MNTHTITPAQAATVRNGGPLVVPLDPQPLEGSKPDPEMTPDKSWRFRPGSMSFGGCDIDSPLAPGDTVEMREPHGDDQSWVTPLGTVISVEVMRLHEVATDEWCQNNDGGWPAGAGRDICIDGQWWPGGAQRAFRDHWNTTHPSHSWDSNPWVVIASMTQQP